MKNGATGRLGRLFFNAVPLESFCPGSVVAKIRNTTDPGTLRAARHSRMILCDERRSGFTLIELLVVVLIIGILSAIALPQYNKAVLKSRAATGLARLSALDQAQTAYHLANGIYATEVDDLGVGVKGVMCHACEDNACVYCQGFNAKAGQGLFFEWQGIRASAKKRWVCAALIGYEAAQSVCRSYYQEWRGTITPRADSEKGYTYYFGAPR